MRTLYFFLGAALPLVFFYALNVNTVTELWLYQLRPIIIVIFAPAIVIAWSLIPAGVGVTRYAWPRACIGLHLLLTLTIALLPLLGVNLVLTSTDAGFELTLASMHAAVIDVLVLIVLPINSATPELKKTAIYGVRCSAVAALVASFMIIPITIARAEQSSAGREYCIILSNQTQRGYHSPTMLDLSAWKMRAYAKWDGGADDLRDQFHALMIIRNGGRYVAKNWSYTAVNFADDGTGKLMPLDEQVVSRLFPSCQFEEHFALHIPMLR